MELTIIDEFTIESSGSLDEHKKLIEEKIKIINPTYYAVDTFLIRSVWNSKIFIME